MRLADVIEATAEAGLVLQRSDGSFPAGHNGPYDDAETPLRNTAHWIVTVLKAYELNGNASFREAARRASNILLAPDARPSGATFLCRTNPAKDSANGLIGQAWVMEALVELHRVLGDDRAREVAAQVFLLHPFSPVGGLWRRVDVDGSLLTVDPTFNHQLWFAAAGALLDPTGDTEIGDRAGRFLDGALAQTFAVRRTGRIRHEAVQPWLARARGLLVGLKYPRTRLKQRRAQDAREVGYHAFNLYAFAILHRWRPEHPLWRSRRFLRALRFVARGGLAGALSNPFGGPYNPVGFEAALAIETFQPLLSVRLGSPVEWIERQLEHTFDASSNLMNRNTPDPQTLAARFYELTRLRATDMFIEL